MCLLRMQKFLVVLIEVSLVGGASHLVWNGVTSPGLRFKGKSWRREVMVVGVLSAAAAAGVCVAGGGVGGGVSCGSC